MIVGQTKESRPRQTRPRVITSPWSAFRHSVFRALWIATIVANLGNWMYNAAAGWLMTSLSADPLIVSLVQVAASLPMFLFALPAGALADIIDKRRFILILEAFVTIISVIFAALVSTDLVTAKTLLLFLFLGSTLTALEAPAWQSIVPQLVPKEDLSSAVAANSVGINISRAVGPALAGAMIAGFGIAAPFWVDAFSNIGVIGVLLWWRTSHTNKRALPAEHFTSAIRAGFRYARNNRHLRATLMRAVGVFLFASSYWALLPLVARNQIAGGPELYGILLGAIGAGAVCCAFVLPRLKAKSGANGLVTVGEVGTAIALLLFGLAREPIMAVSASLIAGMSWIDVLANLNVSAQVALPEWVRGRGLAMYVMVFFGTMTVGSVLWGEIASFAGLPLTHFIAAAGALLAIPLTWRWKLQTGAAIDLTPSMHWPEPIVAEAVEDNAGPVMVTVEYHIDPKNREVFLAAFEEIERERKRGGAYAWGIFQDTADDGRFLETFMVDSWLEHLRQHKRVTNADRVLENQARRFVRDKPTVTHFIAAERTYKPMDQATK
jgi:predicted MFS family arabinose efflux permease